MNGRSAVKQICKHFDKLNVTDLFAWRESFQAFTTSFRLAFLFRRSNPPSSTDFRLAI